MRLQDQVFKAYTEHIDSNMEENRSGALTMKEALEHSPLNWNGVMDKTVHIPKVFDMQTIDHFRRISKTAYRIFCKVIDEYRKSEDYRRLFPFSKELEDLIMIPPSYEGYLPIMRMDIFYNEETGDFRFCEINTDGTAAMIRDYEMRKALRYNPAHQAVSSKFDLQPFELFDTWVETFMSLYETYPGKKDNPHVVLADYLSEATLKEFEEFVLRFQNAGISCGICDIRTMKYEDGVLYTGEGKRIDAIYRRAVTADVMNHYEGSAAFLNAVREDKVFLAGSFSTQIIHNKWLFYVLHRPETLAFLTEEEAGFVKEHVPYTAAFAPDHTDLEEVIEDKDSYIIKPMDSYSSKGIYAAGRELDKVQWEKTCRELYGKGYICQQYCEQYLKDNIDFAWGDGKWHPYINMPGLYVYNGGFTGILMRTACEENIITAHENERTMPVFTVREV